MNKKLTIAIIILFTLIISALVASFIPTTEAALPPTPYHLLSIQDPAPGMTIYCENGMIFPTKNLSFGFTDIPTNQMTSELYSIMPSYSTLYIMDQEHNPTTLLFGIIDGVVNSDESFHLTAMIKSDNHPCIADPNRTNLPSPTVPSSSPFIIHGICSTTTSLEQIQRPQMLTFQGIHWNATHTSTIDFPDIGCISKQSRTSLVPPQ